MLSSETQLTEDLVWSDPDPEVDDFEPSDRGSGYIYGPQQTQDFFARNNITKIIRSHELAQQGFNEVFPNCYTIFSNTNYCGTGNSAAVAKVENDDITFAFFQPLTPNEMKKRRIILPYFILDWLDTDASKSQVYSPPDSLDEIYTYLQQNCIVNK